MFQTNKIKKKLKILVTICILVATTGCSVNIFSYKKWEYDDPKIEKYPKPFTYNKVEPLDKIYELDPEEHFLFPLRLLDSDLSNLDLSQNIGELMVSAFSSNTKWPSQLPKPFNPEMMMKIAKNPGLKISQLHRQGIKGKNISAAIISTPLFIEHEEYQNRIKLYKQESISASKAFPDSSQMTSVLSGKSMGIAPEADIFYFASTCYNRDVYGNSESNLYGYTQAMEEIFKLNKTLPKDRKIRVVLIDGFITADKGQSEFNEEIKKAVKEDILVVFGDMTKIYIANDSSFKVSGLGREPFLDPDLESSYGITRTMIEVLENEDIDQMSFLSKTGTGNDTLLVPRDSFCTASPTGKSDYEFYCIGNLKLSAAYIAGLYILSCQVKPDICPKEFLSQIFDTGPKMYTNINGQEVILGRIVNPVELIKALKNVD